jgi:hypothetical protein
MPSHESSAEGPFDRRERRHRREWRLPLFPQRRARLTHGVQFYDVVVDGARHERAVWPRASMSHVAQRFGFWDEVEVG